MTVRAGQNLDRADHVDPDFRRFPEADAAAEGADRRRGRDAAGFDVRGESDAAKLALCGRGGLAHRQAFVVGLRKRLIEGSRKVAGVIVHQNRSLVRKSLDEVCAAELGGVAPRLTRRDLNQTLDHESRLRAAGAAIGVDRRGVGVDPVDLAVDIGDPVLSRQQRRVEIRRHGGSERREIGAEIGGRVDAEPCYLTAGVQREFAVRNVVAPMRVGEKRLGAIGGPFHRPVDLLGRPDADGFVGVDEDLRAEAAADVGRDDPQLVLGRKTDECRQDHPRNVRVLARRIKRHRVRAGIVVADARRAAPSHSGSGGC